MNALTQQEKKLIRLLPEDGTRPISKDEALAEPTADNKKAKEA